MADRILMRRGNKVDLPLPLNPGEIGVALDTGEMFVGLANGTNLKIGGNKNTRTVTGSDSMDPSLDNGGIIAFNHSAPANLDLPAGVPGMSVTVVDISGNASVNNITFVPNGLDTVNVSGIDVDGGGRTLTFIGNNQWIATALV